MNNDISNLIIDVRGNGGGNSSLGDLLVSYIYDKAFTSFSKVDIKLSQQVIDRYNLKSNTDVGIIQSYDSSIICPSNLKNLFGGRVIILTDRYTFSSATDFVSVIKDYGIGVIIGEETGGLASSYGDVYDSKLPNTDISLRVSYKYFIRPNGIEGIQGVLPDVSYSNNEIASKDVKDDDGLQYALEFFTDQYDDVYKDITENLTSNLPLITVSAEKKLEVTTSITDLYEMLLSNDIDGGYDMLDPQIKIAFSKESFEQYSFTILETFGKDVQIDVLDIYSYSLPTDKSAYYISYILEGNNSSEAYIATISKDMKLIQLKDN